MSVVFRQGPLSRLAKSLRSRARARLARNFAGRNAIHRFTAEPGIGFSVVTGCYNAELYLDDYFSSLTCQTIGFETNIEIIIVDDGSSDRSFQVMEKWKRRYPANILCLQQVNSGVAAARNASLAHARGQWVTFIDADDFVQHDYFEKVAGGIASAGSKIALVSCNVIGYDHASNRRTSLPWMRGRFVEGDVCVDLLSRPLLYQFGVNAVFFIGSVIQRFGLQFNPRIRPNFEDTDFVNRYIGFG